MTEELGHNMTFGLDPRVSTDVGKDGKNKTGMTDYSSQLIQSSSSLPDPPSPCQPIGHTGKRGHRKSSVAMTVYLTGLASGNSFSAHRRVGQVLGCLAGAVLPSSGRRDNFVETGFFLSNEGTVSVRQQRQATLQTRGDDFYRASRYVCPIGEVPESSQE